MGAERTACYFPLLEGKRVAVMTNQTGMAGDEHLVDLLLRHSLILSGLILLLHLISPRLLLLRREQLLKLSIIVYLAILVCHCLRIDTL